jgi:hypothetical protein
MVYYAFDLLHLDGLDTLAAPLIGKLALIKHQRYAHAHQFKRANRLPSKMTAWVQLTSPAKAMKRSWSGGMIGCFSARVLRVIRLSYCSKTTATT